MIKQLHDQVGILAQFSEVRPRFKLFRVATDEPAHFHSQVGHLQLLAKYEIINSSVFFYIFHQGGLKTLSDILNLVEVRSSDQLHYLCRIDIVNISPATVHKSQQDL